MTQFKMIDPKSSDNSVLAKIKQVINNLLKSDFFIKVAETFTTRIILVFLSLFTGIVIARTLGPEGRGLFAMAMVVGTMGVQVSNLGLHSSNTIYVARDINNLPSLLGNSLIISFGTGTIIGLACWIIYLFFPQYAPVDGILLFLGLLWIPIGLACLFLQNLLLGMQKIREFNKIELYAKLFNIFILGTLILLDLVSPITIFSAALLTLPFSSIFYLVNLTKQLKSKIAFSLQTLSITLPFGLKSYISCLLGYVLLRLDLFMVNDILGEGSAGLYDVAFNLSEIFYILPNVIGMILFPKLSGIDNVKEKWLLARNVGIGMIITLVIMSVITYTIAEFLVGILFGEAYLAATSVFILLMVGKVVISINSIFNFFVASIHVPFSSVPFNLALIIINIGLNLIFIEKYGLEGAAISSIICFGLLIPFNIYYTLKYLRNPSTSIK